MIDSELVKQKGKTKGTPYYVAPEVLKNHDFKGLTDLKNIEPHRLRALIYEDLKIYGKSAIGEIHKRIGEEIPLRSVRRQLENLAEEGEISKEGEKKGTRYFIDRFL